MQTPYSLITNQSITDSLIRVPTHDKAEVTEEFNQRLQSLLSCENRLPYLNTASAESQVRQLLLKYVVQTEYCSNSCSKKLRNFEFLSNNDSVA